MYSKFMIFLNHLIGLTSQEGVEKFIVKRSNVRLTLGKCDQCSTKYLYNDGDSNINLDTKYIRKLPFLNSHG